MEAIDTFLMKWILHTFELGNSKMQSLLKYCFKKYNPHKGCNWPPSLKWCVQPYHEKTSNSYVWNYVGNM